MRCAAYARYSSDLQHPASIEDQLFACSRYAGQQGWELVKEHIYRDEAVSEWQCRARQARQALIR